MRRRPAASGWTRRSRAATSAPGPERCRSVGGPAEAFARARVLFEAMGRTIVHVGTRPGDGQRCKMINQLVVAINCVATTEAMRLCEAVGLDPATVLSAISQGAAGSWSLSNLGPKTAARDWAPGFRLRHLLKDLGYCHEAIAGLDEGSTDAFPGVRLARELVRRGVEAGHDDDNIHAIARLFLRESDGRTR